MVFGGPVLRAPIGVENTKVCTLHLVSCPPLDQACALAPVGDDPIRVHQEDGVVAHVVGERNERALCHTRGFEGRIEVGRVGAAFRALPRPQLPPFPGFLALLGFAAR